jgi:hypothetical protein
MRGIFLLLVATVLGATPGWTANAARRHFDIPAGDAVVMLKRAAQHSEAEIVYSPAVVEGVQTRAITGDFTPQEALERMVANTPLQLHHDAQTGAFSILRRAESEPPPTPLPPPPKEPPRSMRPRSILAIIGSWFAFTVAQAQVSGTGTVVGRVLNASNDQYLNNARVVVSGTTIEAFTNDFGEYRLSNVPAGATTIVVTYTGLAPESATVTVSQSQTATRDFNLNRPGAAARDTVIKLDAFVVASAKEMSGREVALNEQRFAANLKNVVSADEFGDMSEGNVGEFLKYIPGITIDYVGADARNISVRGLPPLATPVMVDGAPMASAASSTARAASSSSSRSPSTMSPASK